MQKIAITLGILATIAGHQGFAAESRRLAVGEMPTRAEFDAEKHYSRIDSTNGLPIGVDLYQVKTNELGDIIRASHGNGDRVERAVIKRNLELIAKMEALDLAAAPKNRVSALNLKQRVQTLRAIETTTAYDDRTDFKSKYDPKGAFGFCFGRAYYYANEAGLRGLVKESIKKVFIVGKMEPHSPIFGIPIPVGTWQFHVATAVRGTDGKWYVLDNHYDKSLKEVPTVTEWYNFYRKYLDSKTEYKIKMADGKTERTDARALFLFFTDPDKIGASSNGYNEEGFYGTDINGDGYIDSSTEAFYNEYFIDIDRYFDKMVENLSLCSPIRYAPIDTKSSFCQDPEQKRKVGNWTEYLRWQKALLEHLRDEETMKRISGGG